MAKKYQPAIFQPTVRPDWGGTLSYLSDAEKSEILTALVKFPSVECNSRFWLETIKPDLDLQLSKFLNSNAVKSRGALNRWGKISIPYPNHMDTTSIPYDKDMDKMSNPYGIDTEREREKEKERGKADENSVFHVNCQNFDEIPADILPVMKKYWTDEKIEKIRQDLAFMPSHDTTVSTLLSKYDSDLLKHQPKPKKTVEISNYGQYEYLRPQMDKWLNYKKSRGEKYKTEQSLMVCAKKLHELSGGNALTADAIVEQSIASNYAGLFPLKQPQPNMPRMSLKDMQEMQKRVEIQKILNGEQ